MLTGRGPFVRDGNRLSMVAGQFRILYFFLTALKNAVLPRLAPGFPFVLLRPILCSRGLRLVSC